LNFSPFRDCLFARKAGSLLRKVEIWISLSLSHMDTGFGDQCLNGGRKIKNICQCTKYFAGRICQYIVCLNDGTPINNNTSCVCPDRHIRGRFCETINCENGGVAGNDSKCQCPYNWYSGRFCETYGTPWGMILGVTISLVIFLVIIYFVCRLDLGQLCSCWKSSVQNDDIDPDDGPGANHRRVSRRFSWRRRDNALRHPSIPRETEGNGFGREGFPRSLVQPRLSGTAVTLLFIPSDVKPPDYQPEDAPPPYESVVRNMPAANARTDEQRAVESSANPRNAVSSL